MNQYTMLIKWSDEDQAYLVIFPEWWPDRPMAHGKTYQEAADSGAIMLDLLIETRREQGLSLPEPQKYVA